MNDCWHPVGNTDGAQPAPPWATVAAFLRVQLGRPWKLDSLASTQPAFFIWLQLTPVKAFLTEIVKDLLLVDLALSVSDLVQR